MEPQQEVVRDVPASRSQTPRTGRKPPSLSGGVPVLGHTIEFLRSTIELLFRAQREHGEAASFQVAHRRIVALFGPEAHEAVFRAQDRQLSPREAYKIMTPVFGKGIAYDAPPEIMDEQLKMFLPALKDARMRTYGEVVLNEVERSLEGWGDEGEIDIVDYCRVLTTYTSSHCLIGREFRENMTEQFASIYHDLERGVTPLSYVNENLPLPSFRRRDQARVRLVEMISQIVSERRRKGESSEDLLQTLMEARYSTGAPLTDDEITGLLLAALFAGHHTSSVTTAWTLIELLQNQEYLKTVLQQLNDVYGETGTVTYQSLRQIPFTEYAVKEALRLHPPLFMLIRVALEDFTFKDYFMPRGTWIAVSPTVSHRIASVFPDPDRFNPMRFSPQHGDNWHDFAYIPFGGGRHKCLGNAFALLQVKAILAVLLRRYTFELVGDRIASDFHGLVVGPAQPCRLRYRRREKPATASMAAPVGTRASSTPSGCPVAHAVPSLAMETRAKIPSSMPPKENVQRPSLKLRVELDHDLCQGHAVCVGEAPQVFAIGEDGKVMLRTQEIPQELYDDVRRAAQYCPTHTIRLHEGSGNASEPKCPV